MRWGAITPPMRQLPAPCSLSRELGSEHSVNLVGRTQVIEDELHRLEAQNSIGFDASRRAHHHPRGA